MLFTSAAFSASGMASRLIASAGGADDRGLREGARQQPRGGPHVEPEELCRDERADQTGDAQHDGDRELGQRILLQPAKELGPDLVADREEEQIEEDVLDDRIDLDVKLPMTTPASNVPTTVPRLNEPKRSFPIEKPTARVRKIVSSGWFRRASTTYSIMCR
jgi:hypothetical protein